MSTPSLEPAATHASQEADDRNETQPWDSFDSQWYLSHNYEQLRYDDNLIIRAVARFFAAHCDPDAPREGIDVGSGTNLYPALAMLPFCRSIVMAERSRTNVAWLRGEVDNYGPGWDPFWAAMVEAGGDGYQRLTQPRTALAARARVEQRSVFSLSERRWDIGTMFFVAESITGRTAEFEVATRQFVRALRPSSPFAAAFMRGSLGYQVNQTRYPAVAVDENQIRDCLAPVAYDVDVALIPTGPDPLRDGYEGMLLATGFAGDKEAAQD